MKTTPLGEEVAHAFSALLHVRPQGRAFLSGAACFLLLAGCALVNDEEFNDGGDVAMSPIAVLVPRARVLPSAESFAEQRPTGFVFVNNAEDMLPRYTPGTVLVAEPSDYRSLRRGMTVIFIEGSRRVAHALVMRTADGWVTRGFNAKGDDPNFMTEANYLGTVVMAFAPEQTTGEN